MSFIGLNRLEQGPWPAFERMIARYLEHRGLQGVEVVGGANDKGADIVASLNGKGWLVQAKFSAKSSAKKKAVEEAYKAQFAYKVKTIVVATNQRFAPTATRFKNELRDKGFDLHLWDRDYFLQEEEILENNSKAKRELRSYQREAVDKLHLSLDSDRGKGLVTLATGLGKTVVASTFIAEYIERSRDSKVLVLAHLSNLVRQLDTACWSQFSKDTETHVWTDGEKPAYNNGVTFATWQCVDAAMKRGEDFGSYFDLVVIDECHHAASLSYWSTIEALKPKYLLGLTATPFRGDNISLAPLFGEPVFSMNVVEGMQRKWLAKVDYRMLTDGIDWDDIKDLSKQGLSIKDLNAHLYVPERDQGMVKTICETIDKTLKAKTLVFCRSIEHAERMQNFFKMFDTSAGVIHSQLHRAEKFNTMTAFRDGSLKVLISIEMLNEGIDVPDVNIIIFARVTHSRRIFLQQLGRGLRLNDDKSDVTVLDFVADVRRVAEGIKMNSDAKKVKEEVRYPDGEIVKFSIHAQGFFAEYLEDMANLSDLDENSFLEFPPE